MRALVFLLALASAPALAGGASPGYLPMSRTGGGGGPSSATLDATYLRLDTTNDPLTGCLSIDDVAAGAVTVICEASLDRSSGSAVTFNFTNSGAGAMQVQEDGIAMCTVDEACLLTGAADCTFVGGTGPRSATNADLPLESQGTGDIQIISGGDDHRFASADGVTDILITTRQAATGGSVKLGTNAAINGTTNGFIIHGSTSDQAFDGCVDAVADGIEPDGDVAAYFECIYGTGMHRYIASFGALTIGNPTDTTSTPLSVGSNCKMSSAAATAWTVSEGGSPLDGMDACCTNTGSFAITMTASAGVYVGPGSVITTGQEVCMRYVTDHWEEVSVSNTGAVKIGDDLTVTGGDITLASGVAIHGSASGMNFDVPTSAAYSYDVNGSQVFACDDTGCAVTSGLDFVPTASNTSDLGQSGLRFRQLFLSNDTSGAIDTYVVPGQSIGATVGIMPTCDSTIGGAYMAIDDTNDSKPMSHCYCTSDASDVYGWVGYAFSLGVPVAANCPP